MTHAPVTRRLLLGSLTAILAATVAPEALAAPDPQLARRLLWTLPDLVGARGIGIAYLRANPGEADAARLLRALAPRDASRADLTALRAYLRDLRARDFAAGHTIRIGGRTFTRSEARLYALAVLV